MKFKELFKLIYRKLKIALRKTTPFRILSLGFMTYVLIGVFFISMPFSQKTDVGIVDNFLNVVSAMSTTGLTTGALGQLYTFWGKLVLLILMQLGAIGYMTLTSFFILSGGNKISNTRIKTLNAEFSLPEGFSIKQFVRHVVIFSFITESIGAILLYICFRQAGADTPLWSGIFHSVSAFATAGLSLYSNSMEAFKDNTAINIIIGLLCYTGAIGFIVPLDIYRKLTGQSKKITFTSKVILSFTASIFIFGSLLYVFCQKACGGDSDILYAMFQIMSASTTAGFNSVHIGALSHSTLALIIFVMLIGASPSGTGGGVKTTTLSAFIGLISSVLHGRTDKIRFFKRVIPLNRVLNAVAVIGTYIMILFVSIFCLCLCEKFSFLELCFEATSALGTVGLSMGITPHLSNLGKIIITVTMFLGRIGPLTLGLAFFYKPQASYSESGSSDLAV